MAGFPQTSLFRHLTVATFAVALCGPAIAQQHGKFMKRSATAEEWVNALKANPMGRTRGIVMDDPKKAQPKPSAQALISFEFNSAVLTPDAKQQLESLAAALKSDALKDDRFRVEGHTDAVGSESYNLELSKRRARAVKQYLMQMGSLGAEKLRSVGKGESELFDNANPDAAVNRRVVITNLGQ
jgi:outer membrane protein OmpA-like peptidoglycan-associated protein